MKHPIFINLLAIGNIMNPDIKNIKEKQNKLFIPYKMSHWWECIPIPIHLLSYIFQVYCLIIPIATPTSLG